MAYHDATGLCLPQKMARRWAVPRGYVERLLANGKTVEVTDEENPRRVAFFAIGDYLRRAGLTDRNSPVFSPDSKPWKTGDGKIWFNVRQAWSELRYIFRDAGFNQTHLARFLKEDFACERVKIKVHGVQIRCWVAEKCQNDEITIGSENGEVVYPLSTDVP